MGTALTISLITLSNLAIMFLTAWLLHRHQRGLTPMPSLPRPVEIENIEEAYEREAQPKGRPVL